MKIRSRQPFHPSVAYILRKGSSLQNKIEPNVNHEQHVESTLKTNDSTEHSATISETLPTSSLEQKSKTPIDLMKSPTSDISPSSQQSNLSPMLPETTKNNPTRVESVKAWWKNLSPKQKLVFVIVACLILSIIVLAATIIPSVLILVVNKQNLESSFTNVTVSICPSDTCIGKETPYGTSMTTVLYPFDGHAIDLISSSAGTVIGSNPTPYNPYSYIGTQTLSINQSPSTQQYVQIPYVNLSHRSFTIELWVYIFGISLTSDYGIFGQCDSNNICLSISLRNGRFFLSFDAMNPNSSTLVGATVNQVSYWLHLAVVYDIDLYQQQIYVNGQLDAISYGRVTSFQGTSTGSVTTIGRSISFAYNTTYFQGRIDHFMISAGSARAACQIYNDATLSAYFPFDSLTIWNDYSANIMNGFGVGVSITPSGRTGQAIYFGSNTSYFQSECFPAPQYGNPPFSMAFWIYAVNPNIGGSLVHISNLQNGNGSSCYDLLVLTSTGTLVVQLMQGSGNVNAYQGPSIPSKLWTHVTVVYGPANGVRVYINGLLTSVSSGVSTVTFNSNNNDPFFLTLANNSPFGPSGLVSCRAGMIPILPGPFTGALDDFRLYSRELTVQEICKLANL